MNAQCTKCGADLESRWGFCPQCGSPHIPEPEGKTELAPPERTALKTGFGGLLIGVLAAPVCLIVGIMLCLTGLGAIAGIPLIIAGIFAPLIGALLGMSETQGKCPWCGTPVSNIFHSKGFACHACGNRIAVKDRGLDKAA